MVMRQSLISSWCRPYQLEPGRDGTGPHASKGPTQATGASVDLSVRGRQSSATDQPAIPLNVVQWNAEGVRNKKPELMEFLRENNIDIICIQETHLKESHRFFVRGYELFRHDRPTRHKGGILTLVKNTIPAVEICKSGTEDLEFQTIKVILPDRDLLLTNCYSPPASDLGLHRIALEKSKHLIIGDFNSHSPSWGYNEMDSRGEALEDWMMENRLILINRPDDKPTCYSRAWKTTSTPDLAMATDDVQSMTTRTVQKQLGGSDHLPVIIEISNIGHVGPTNMAPSWNYKKADWERFRQESDMLCDDITLTDSLNSNVKLFTDAILQAAKTSIPRGKRYQYKPYWNKTLEELHDQLQEAREEMERNPTAENTQKHISLRDTFNKEKMDALQNSWHEKTSSLSMEKDTTKLWTLTKALNEETGNTRARTVLEEDGKHHTGKMAANLLADNFKAESTTKLTRSRIQEVRKEIRERTKQKDSNAAPSMTSDFTPAELNNAIKKLKNKKAPGKDGITNEMIKHQGHKAKNMLLQIINQSWKTGKYPDKWREAIIVPIKKKLKDKTKKSSYRPISLLCCLGKVMERMVNARLLKHLEKNQILISTQSAYRKNRNTEDQLTYLAQGVENAFQEKKKVLAVFVDLTKAFDKVWKEGLLVKLLRNKVEGRMYSWIQNFLQYRTARVKLDGHYISHRVPLQQGVPQGGVISPTLFLLFINDITEQLSNHICNALHADDFAAWCAAERLSTANCRMQDALNIIGQWSVNWGVEINTPKTVTSCFSLSTIPEKVKLKLNEEDLEQVDNPVYLGVRLDKRPTWSAHLKEVEKKATRKLALMKKLSGTSWGANSNILKKVYVGAVRPTLEYGMSAWATASKTNTARLTKVQNAGLRLITGGMKTTPIQEMEQYSNIRSLDERREERVFIHSEKLKRIPTHPLHNKLQDLTQNRLKRTSFNHISRQLHRQHEGLLPTAQDEMEMLPDFEDPEDSLEGIPILCEVPGIDKKGHQNPHLEKALTLELIEEKYNAREWTHVYTDGSSEDAVKNGGGGIYILHSDGTRTPKAFSTGKTCSNVRAEATAMLKAVMIFNTSTKPPPSNIVFLTDCKSVLQGLQNTRNEQLLTDTRKALLTLSKRSNIALQWIPSHCGVCGNERADELSIAGSRMPQRNPQISYMYREAKTIIHNHYQNQWKRRMCVTGPPDPIHQLKRHQQTTLFRLRTGHCRLLSHLHRLRISHTDECPCGTGRQTPEHVLQDCPTHTELRHQTWPEGASIRQQLWGSSQDLERTVWFIGETGLQI